MKRVTKNDGYSDAPADIERSLDMVERRGQFMTAKELIARTKKDKITLRVDSDVLTRFRNYARANNAKYQTLMNEVLRGYSENLLRAK